MSLDDPSGRPPLRPGLAYPLERIPTEETFAALTDGSGSIEKERVFELLKAAYGFEPMPEEMSTAGGSEFPIGTRADLGGLPQVCF